MTIKVKPLVWVHGAKFCGQDHSYADTELGTWSMTAYSGRGGRWAYTDLCGNDSEGDWPTRDECQAAVEATREASIRSELEPKRELFWDYDSRCVVFDSTMSFSNAYSWEGWDIRQEAVTDRGAYAIWREHLAKDEYSLYGTADGLYIQGGMTEAEAKAAAQADYEARIRATIEAPDHLALVAAAYRDAAEAIDADGEYVRAIGLSKRILARTPADAEAQLTTRLRAEYERGVRDAADAVPVDQYHESWMARMLVCARVRILALLTQEGR